MSEPIYWVLLFYLIFRSPVQFAVFVIVLILVVWLLSSGLRKYLQSEDERLGPDSAPFPLWMWALMVIAAFFPAFVAAMLTPV